MAPLGILNEVRATCYPSDAFTKLLPNYVDSSTKSFHGIIPAQKNAGVVVDGHIITSRGPATSIPFALSVIDSLCGKERAEAVAAELLFQ